jgi:RNA polymerase sigma factor (sigma-70 family)
MIAAAAVSDFFPWTFPWGAKDRLVSRAAMAFIGRMQDTPITAVPPAADASAMDDLLVAVGRGRDRAAFAQVFGFFAPRVKAYLRRLGADPAGAEELVQEVMLTVWRRAETFDPHHAAASTWIFAIARNKRVDALRREPRPEYDPEDPALIPDPEEGADVRIENAQFSQRLRTVLKELPPEQAELLHLAYFEDKPHSQIAAERGLPLGTVKSRLRLAMERMRKALKDMQ